MSTQATAVRIPEAMGVAEIGPYLQGLREHFSLTLQEVSDRLHIRLRYISAMEAGQFDLLPGKAYARGYLHTYAEFLGLDADQVVAQCFKTDATALATAAPAPFIPSPVRAQVTRRQGGARWRNIGILITVVLVTLVALTQFVGTTEKQETTTATTTPRVAPVPEAMLASVRDAVMPTPRNMHCLTENLPLACLFAQGPMQTVLTMKAHEAVPYRDDISTDTAPETFAVDVTEEAPGVLYPFMLPIGTSHD